MTTLQYFLPFALAPLAVGAALVGAMMIGRRFMTSVCLAIGLASLVMPAGAVDFSQKFTQMDGHPFADEVKNPEASTLRSFAVTALTAAFPDEQNLSTDEKLSRYVLAKRIRDSKGDLPLTVEETALLKMVLGKALQAPMFLGQAFEMLDPASVRKAEGTPISAPKK